MPIFTNKSTAVFQDGDLIVAPGESFSTEDESRCAQMRGLYAWQFNESEGEDAVSEGELSVHPEDRDIREIRGNSHVALDEEGNQTEVAGSPEPAEDAAKKPAKSKK